jgi:hypothetical protein
MNITEADIENLEASIRKREAEIELDRRAVNLMRELLQAKKQRGGSYLPGDPLAPPERPKSLVDYARESLDFFEGREFTMKNLVAAMVRNGAEITAKNPIARMSRIMKDFEDGGLVEVVSPSKGRSPNIYILTKTSRKDPEVGEIEEDLPF